MPNVSLTGPMEEYVQKQLETGAYANVSEVVRAGLRILMEKEGARHTPRWPSPVVQEDQGGRGGGQLCTIWAQSTGTGGHPETPMDPLGPPPEPA